MTIIRAILLAVSPAMAKPLTPAMQTNWCYSYLGPEGHSLGVRFGSKDVHIGAKWDKSRTF